MRSFSLLRGVLSLTVLTSLAGALNSSGQYLAPTGQGPYLDVQAGAALVQGIKDSGGNHFDLSPGPRVTLGVGYTLYNSSVMETSLELESGFIYNKFDKIKVAGSFEHSASGELWQVPIIAEIIYGWHICGWITPYAGVGGGVVYSHGNPSSIEFNRSNDSTDGAVQAMTGVRFKLSDTIEVGAGYKFLSTFPSHIDYVATHTFGITLMVRFP